jgi:uncharacterized protein (TIGR03067 family)
MLRFLLTLGAAALSSAAVFAFSDQGKAGDKNAAAQLAGNYSIVAGEREGQAESPEHIRGDTVTFTDSTVTVTDKDKKETYVAGYTIDSSQKPWVIVMTEKSGPTKGEKARGLIERRGNTVKLIYALPGGDMPTGFDKTKPKQLMFVLKHSDR